MGAAGRDFHNFNTFFRENQDYQVVAFTATQIPDIQDRKYPAQLAGSLYPDGIPIYPEEELPDLIHTYKVDEVVFSYSDVSHEYVMQGQSGHSVRGGLPADGRCPYHAEKCQTGGGYLRRAYRKREKPDYPQGM